MGEAHYHLMNPEHAGFMRRALELAARGEGLTTPNPVVGCVVAKDGVIVGEGWHMGPGRDHAEPAALKAAGEKARGASVYVTLEPCNHFGRTPPCAQALIESGVKEVFYALADPNPLAAGGAEALEAAGIKTHHGLLEKQGRRLNRIWLHNLTSDRPYVIAKFAISLDGKIATRTGHSQWITGTAARGRGHELRRLCDAIVVGAGTVIADDPALTTRLDHGPDDYPYQDYKDRIQPLRVIMDTKGRTPPGAHVYDRAGAGALIATTDALKATQKARYKEHGVDVLPLPFDQNKRPDAHSLLTELKKTRDCQSVLVEGGAGVLGAFFDAGLIDEVYAFIAPILIGGAGPAPIGGLGAATIDDAIRLHDIETDYLGHDFLIHGFVRDNNFTKEETA